MEAGPKWRPQHPQSRHSCARKRDSQRGRTTLPLPMPCSQRNTRPVWGSLGCYQSKLERKANRRCLLCFGSGFCVKLWLPSSSLLHTSLVLLSQLLRLLFHISLPSPVTQSAKLLLECENSYCLPHHPDVSDAMIKYFARPHPLSV